MTTPFLDAFTEASNTNLEDHTPTGGTAWTLGGGATGAAIVQGTNNALRSRSATPSYYICDDQGSANQYVQARLKTLANSFPESFVACRLVDASNLVGWRCAGTGSAGLRLCEVVAGLVTDKYTFQGVDESVYRVEVDGTTARIYEDTVQKGTDQTVASSTETSQGVRIGSDVALDWIDDFEAGSLSAGTTTVSNDLADSYTVVTTIASDLADSYIARSSTSNDLVDSYDLRSDVPSDLADSYTVNTGVSEDLADSYALRSNISNDYGDSYAIASAGIVSNDFADTYEVRTSVSEDSADTYVLRSLTVTDLADAYVVGTYVSSDLQDDYALVNSINSDYGDSYAVGSLDVVNTDLADDYVVRSYSNEDLLGNYDVLGTASSDYGDSYVVVGANNIYSDLDDSFYIAESVGNDLDDSYALVTGISSDFLDSYMLRKTISSDHNDLYGVIDNIKSYQLMAPARIVLGTTSARTVTNSVESRITTLESHHAIYS